MAELTKRERMAMPRTGMPERDADERARSFDEVNLGYTEQLAVLEASRCLQCTKPKCVEGCPVGVKIGDFVTAIAAEDFQLAAQILADDNSLPAVCGRVCPQEKQCEEVCIMGRKGESIAIGHLERFVADFVPWTPPTNIVPTGFSVGVIGSGPAGLACAFDLARLGHEVVVYEALHEPGGVLIYGIPSYRLPKEVVAADVARLRAVGVRFEMDAPIGKAESLEDLLERHQAVFVGTGAGLPKFLNVPGEHLVGVQSANEFLTRVNLMRAYLPDAETPVSPVLGKSVAVIGGGNTAMDAVRTAQRMGAETATIYYRRTEAEMPARIEEIRHAKEEGIIFELLAAPTAFHGNERGVLTSMTLQRMELGEPDDSGRRRPQPIEGAEEELPIDVVVVAAGNAPNPMLAQTPGLEFSRWGTVVVDEDTYRTTKPGVYAGGDIVTGGATVILAMGAGRSAAASINRLLTTGDDRIPEPVASE